MQNFFDKRLRTITLNTHYVVFFKNPRDTSQIQHLGRQMGSKILAHAYKDATSEPYGYLLVDLKQDTPEEIRLRTGIKDMYAYVSKSI